MLTRQSSSIRPVNGRYARSGFTEALRQLLRATDFLFLLLFLNSRRGFPSLRAMHQHFFVELGPGPTRLAWLKAVLLRDVRFIDQSDFGQPDERLRLFDLSSCGDIDKLVHEVGSTPRGQPTFLFADHCLEHLRPDIVANLFRSLAETYVAACFRVPNVLSPRGQRNYDRDLTHRTSFDTDFREILQKLGFHVIPFVRWYRPMMMISFLLQPTRRMGIADEIMIYKRSGLPQV